MRLRGVSEVTRVYEGLGGVIGISKVRRYINGVSRIN